MRRLGSAEANTGAGPAAFRTHARRSGVAHTVVWRRRAHGRWFGGVRAHARRFASTRGVSRPRAVFRVHARCFASTRGVSRPRAVFRAYGRCFAPTRGVSRARAPVWRRFACTGGGLAAFRVHGRRSGGVSRARTAVWRRFAHTHGGCVTPASSRQPPANTERQRATPPSPLATARAHETHPCVPPPVLPTEPCRGHPPGQAATTAPSLTKTTVDLARLSLTAVSTSPRER
jgi:hypothetical protein